ncbi:hypothetical protein E2N93_06725 [Ruminococcus bromii]|uniref:Uncharacterized protein n=1 Tax=Ruminococcus bromii TaxID=40518 RepID=A0ABT0NHJ2_9FIRM|nr:hypothetical protein [Ruminococcus bromii]MCL3787700.1 hypothetical protein [Ruminococcus bromii]
MTTKETKNTTNTNETTESEKNTVKRTNKKTVGLIVGATVTVAAVIISMLCLSACNDKQPTATADEVIGTSVQTVTQVVTDSQGNTHIEEATKVVEVKQTQPAEKSEKATEVNAQNVAKNDNKQNNGGQSNGSSNQNNNNNNDGNGQTSKSNSSSGSTNKPASNSGSNSSSSQSKPSGGSSSSSSQNKPSSGSGSSSSSSSKPEPTPQPATQDPHEGKTWHEAEYKTEKVWVVDEEACTWQRPIYEEHYASICNTCGEEITGHTSEHMFAHMEKGENGSYRGEMVTTIVGYETVEEPEVGHWETKTELVREAGWY